MTIQQLRYFLTLAENLHFRAAAAKLYIAQPALSHSIAALEAEIDVRLFHRTRRSVELTPAGRVFLQEAGEIVKRLDEAVQKARLTQLGYNGSLTIGLLGGLSKGAFPETVASFRAKYPQIHVRIEQTNMVALHDGLLRGTIDLALTRSIDVEGSAQDLAWVKLYEDSFCLFVHKDHPLVGAKSVDLATLRDEPFVMIDRAVSPRVYQYVLQICARRGLVPNIRHTAPTLEATCTLISAGLGIAVLPVCAEEYNKGHLYHIDLQGDDVRSNVVLAWRRRSPNSTVAMFLHEMGFDTSTVM